MTVSAAGMVEGAWGHASAHAAPAASDGGGGARGGDTGLSCTAAAAPPDARPAPARASLGAGLPVLVHAAPLQAGLGGSAAAVIDARQGQGSEHPCDQDGTGCVAGPAPGYRMLRTCSHP